MTKTEPMYLALGMIFLLQTIVGVLGNLFLPYHYLFLYHSKSKLRYIDLILRHIFIANSLLILSKGPPQIIVAFGLKHSFNDFVCKLILYVERVGRGMSIGTICLLSIFQTIMISPTNSCWKNLKIKAPKYLGLSICLCWFQHTVVNFIFPIYLLSMSAKRYSRNITKRREMRLCPLVDHGKILGSVYMALVAFPEVIFSILMICASGSMIFTLYQHKQRVQHLHRKNVFSRSPESRATKSIFLLVGTFVSFYSMSSIFNFSIAFFPEIYWWLVSISDVISLCFPTMSPFLIMSQDSSISRLCFFWIRNTLSPYKK
ncbi:PREDICTED: vomeronasal type-1 receptor 4-like [Chinchilla lanigera]|uniref:vomeronasal type-1 receptor 4-like n=1 Tax=Chinchilla lanigera TaxID=34839 RepID=UPI00038F049D|nr:PREDICTED: vomeronasal type-1 receptor 4-like [Chinchilla lanigera]